MHEGNIRKAIKRHDTGKWDWSCIDACLTGQDSDLEPWGQQGIEIVEANERVVTCVLHIGKTVIGMDVLLNVPPSVAANNDAYCKIRDAYLDQANEIVCECSIANDWTDGDWYLYGRFCFNVHWKRDKERVVNFNLTAIEILRVASDRSKTIEQELERMNDALGVLAGWIEYDKETGEYIKCEEFEPGPESICYHIEKE